MRRAANDDRLVGQPLGVPHAARGSRLSNNLQAEAQDRIGTALRALYSDLLQQPLPHLLVKLIGQINTRLETSCHAG
jgi:hypothetical protein